MTYNLRHTFLLIATFLLSLSAAAQSVNIRYVSTTGDNAKDGTSWTNAKKDIQDAINDLVNNNILTGEVWVAAGTYYPTETTESSVNQCFKTFKIPAGITVRGGFAGTEDTLLERAKNPDKNFGDGTTLGNLDGEAATSGVYVNETILCGDLTPGKQAKLTWNATKQQFDVAFYGNSYHVVWFAMNGFDARTGRANPLARPAKLEGCIVEGGHANSHDLLSEHPHTAYGGGIYMVLNSFVYNCEVRNCDASRNGGGIYMDGGGVVRRTYVHDCQALGLGTDFGYGGGICQNGGALTAKERPCVVAQSVVTNCVGRMGGGIATMADQTSATNKYAVVSNSTLVNNCTATIEGGGVYTYKGGGVASLTIVNNKCSGSSITQNGILTGRSGGLYSYDASYVANTVIWGNKCDANNDVQFASSNSSLTSTEKTLFYYNAVSKADNTDWSGTTRMGVTALDTLNSTTGTTGNLGYPLFFQPTASAGYLATATTDGSINWKVSSESSLTFAGIATIDLDTEGVTPAPEHSWDMQFSKFNSRPTIGAFVSQKGDVAPAENVTYNGTKYDYALFVDPQFIYAADNTETNGATWEHPVRFLGNALDYVEANKAGYTGKKVAIFVKEGTVDNTRDAGADRIRVTSLDIPGDVSVFGSFDSGLTGTTLTLQNVVRTPTVISAKLMNQYNYNVAHLISIKDKENIHFEGFKLSFANASSTDLSNTNKDGAAITITNSNNITFRNIIVSNCTADRGAAVYADHTTDTHFVNCIFHNNESKVLAGSGIIYATNGSALTFDHCDVLRNVGHASYLGSNSTTNEWSNSIFYGNMNAPMPDTNSDMGGGIEKALPAFSGTTTGATGNHCMFDAKSESIISQFGGGDVATGGDTGNKWQYNLQYAFVDGTGQGYPRFINPTKNAGVTTDGDATYYGRSTSFEPHNNNPAVNMASHVDIHTSWGRDIVGITRDFGGLPDIGAVENHEAKRVEEGENAYTDGQKAYGNGFFVRDYTATGTQMDTYDMDGAGNLTKNAEGKGIYNAAGELLDGTSWQYAINGNALYEKHLRKDVTLNSVFRSAQTVVDYENFRGTFIIRTTAGRYMYLNSSGAPKSTTDASQATHFEVESVTTTAGIAAGTKYIRAIGGTQYYYIYRSSNNASGTTTQQRVELITADGGFNIKANGQLYVDNTNGNITAIKNAASPAVWVFEPVYGYQNGPESPYKEDGVTPVTGSEYGYNPTAITAGSTVVDPMNFHVYKSLDDYLYSSEKKTYKIRGSVLASNDLPVHLTHSNGSFYPYPSWVGTGDEFILIQDGATDKYYIYDVTADKYIINKSGVKAGTEIDKTTWWVKPKDGDASVLQFVYGGQPWNTTGNYAISFNQNQTQAAKLQAKSVEQTKLYLVASQNYNAINYAISEDVDESLRGLQFAVNNAHKAFETDYAETRSYEQSKKEVWVGAGVYKSAPTYLDEDNEKTQLENCFVIQDGVAVYGAFPKTGNPGLDQRQALVSQYVHVQTGSDGNPLYHYDDFETILEPLTPTDIASAANVTHRVLGQPYTYNPRKYQGTGTPCPKYLGAKWDGFTIRNGWYDSNKTNFGGREGGAGAIIFHNVTLKNVIITNNTNIHSNSGGSNNFRGGGLYMDGGILDAGYVINNVLAAWSGGAFINNGGAGYGGGVYMYSGTAFNSVIANNLTKSNYADGGGIYIENANFFNNTIVNNHSDGNIRAAGGVGLYSDPGRGDLSTLNVFNCIILNNEGYKGGLIGNKELYVTNNGKMNLHNCLTEDITNRENGANFIKFDECKAVASTGFAALIDNLGGYSDRSLNAFKNLNLRLKSGSMAINSGIDAPTAYDYNLAHNVTYDLEEFNDMDYAERIQDCRVDIGAYEFNGATDITPQESENQAIYYVTPNGYGTTNASDPENAACAQKLQRVLDAAGRYKYLNPGKQVIVKVANSYDFLHPNNGSKNPGDDGYVEPTNFTYYATRTTDWTDQDVRVWSIIVPRGVEVWGGYTDIPTTKDANGIVVKNTSNTTWSNSNNGFALRSITANPTYFDSYYRNKLEKTDANTYHVVWFTDRIYDLNGYAYTKADFEGKTADQVRTILENGSSSAYVELLDNDESHFVHLSEDIGTFKGITGNIILDGAAPKNFGTVGTPKYASNRAVIDGIFVSGGKADAPINSTNTTVNINSYGGAALVNDFAYVRNCILIGNTAINGGALALTDRALVSGCLIMDNEAHNDGGGIYVFENGTKLSNGTIVNTDAPTDKTMDYNMSHVITSTIVQNTAQRGGGVWYSNQNHASVNVRFNSVAIWQNEATEQANVYGMINPEQPTDDETISEIYYPFSYSAIENARASGTNNLSVGSINHEGMRFVTDTSDVGQDVVDQTDMAEEQSVGDKFEHFGFYGLSEYSLLCSNGMPVSMYNQLKAAIAIADDDILGTSRLPQDSENIFVEIGARALEMLMPKKQLMLRLFVADPKYVDTKTATRFMRLRNTAGEGTREEYYSQVGSSFAYPFNSLQNALDYIKEARNGKIIKNNDDSPNYDAQHLPFEILVGRGEYYPKQSLNAETQSVWSATFAIPEGVTVIGGFDPKGGTGTYYGRYYTKADDFRTKIGADSYNIYNNIKEIPATTQSASGAGIRDIGRGYYSGIESLTLPANAEDAALEVTFQQWHIQDIADRRGMADNNKNGIIEPWEFRNQTIISGNAVNGETDGVYHVMTAVADEDAVGRMPKVQSVNHDFVGNTVDEETGYQWKEEGQQIRLNGLIITGGNALTYLSTALDEYGKYIFYQGAGLQVDGNRYKNHANDGGSGPAVFHNSAAYGVGYRDIPVSVTSCQFRNNIAGYGGAISTNGSLSLFGSSFEQNLALAQTEQPEDGEIWTTDVDPAHLGQTVSKVMYPGQGGAILATHQLCAFNTLFANNEARLADGEIVTIDLVKHPTFRVPVEANASATLRAAGGAIMMGSAGNHHIVNCDFVRNKANAYPAVFTMNPTTRQPDVVNTHDYSQIINTVAWGNEVNADVLAKFSGNTMFQTASKLMVNIGKKGRTQNYILHKGAGDFYNPSFLAGNVPAASDLTVANPEAGGNDTWQESVWFCAYEDGMGFKQNNLHDLRNIIYSPSKFAPKMIIDVNDGVYQNCNIQIVADNSDLAGPNFGNPSHRAGYDGFMEGADWSPARVNRLTDQGNGWIRQSVAKGSDDYIVTFHNDDQTPAAGQGTDFQGAYSITHYISELTSEHQFPEYKLWLSIGNEKYMQATNDSEKDMIYINSTSLGHPNKNYPRISPDPTMGVTKAYIDIGVYEYQKQPLLKPGSEVDILWVSTKEHLENGPATGATWKTPTSDLQRAINTLLSSRNGHKKEIRIMEGEYTPVTAQLVNGEMYNAFVIDTKSLNEACIVPSSFDSDSQKENYYAQSLTIKGGYSAELMYEYDPSQYKTVIRQHSGDNASSTDHLFYVADPTLRYAYEVGNYNYGNKYGAICGSETEVKTMPIQVDGVIMINSEASVGTQGAAIYYPDMTTTTKVHPISVGGEVIYYENKDDLDNKENPVDHETEFAAITATGAGTIDSPAKLVITKTQVLGSGAPSADNPASASAVYIGQNGGSALIYNSVFHSNYGMPLDAYNTVNVNNTFALNSGLVRLRDVGGVSVNSAMYNSALWRNNSDGLQFSIPGVTVGAQGNTGNTTSNFTYNAFTGGNTVYSLDSDIGTNNYNTGLTDVNNDLASGPNFLDPENPDLEARNFDIKPSVRLLNRGNGTRTAGTPDIYAGTYNTIIVAKKFDYSLASTYDRDALYRTRIVSNDDAQRIDIGAYEFQGSLYNPLYVDPNKSHNDAAEGRNWDDAFGFGDIQNAMDLAAIYHINNPREEAYVFVKGASATNSDLHSGEALTIRDGVTVYGSIISSYADWHGSLEEDHITPKYADIPAYIAAMTSIREGVAGHTSSKTLITGLNTSVSESYNGFEGTLPAVIDGFVVTPANKAVQPTAPVITLANVSPNASIAVRNVIVADNDLSATPDQYGSNIDVAQVSNGLLYEVLMRDNKPKGNGAVLNVSGNGYAVNVTVEGKTVGANGTLPIDGKSAAAASDNVESATHIYSSITNSVSTGSASGGGVAGAAAPYGAIANPDISGYFYNIGDANLNYQLTETSKYIDQCEVSEDANGHPTFLPRNLTPLITYRTDRDLIGNPRLLTGVTTASKIDRGAFETWKVDNVRGEFVCGELGNIGIAEPYASNVGGVYTYIKKHFYPHDGSVCYIMEDQRLVIDPFDSDHEVKPTPHNPGYMLLKEGASFYGNGRPATCAYVAVERSISREHGGVIAIPYDVTYSDGVTLPKYTNGRLTALQGDVTAGIYDYNGVQRSGWDNIFRTSNTDCWTLLNSDATVAANQGVLLEGKSVCFAGGATEATLRFTAKGSNLTDFVYVEDSPSKTVELTQYDDSQSTGGAADFTNKEDMGWNCIGLPYLVSDYKPYQMVNPATGLTANDGTAYRMHLPHTLWLYYDGVRAPDGSTADGDGGYYSVNAWENTTAAWHVTTTDDACIWVGEGIFVQTASTSGHETVTFYLPDYRDIASPSNRRHSARYYYDPLGDDDSQDDYLSSEVTLLRREYYSVSGCRLTRPVTDGVTIIREVYSDGSVRSYKTQRQ